MAKRALIVVAALLEMACGDNQRRRVAGNYCLDRWHGGQLYTVVGCSLAAKLPARTENGPLEGNVRQIGWNQRLIVAQRAHLIGEKLGWMILDTQAESLKGPFTDDEFARLRQQDPELKAIVIHSPLDAWELLE